MSSLREFVMVCVEAIDAGFDRDYDRAEKALLQALSYVRQLKSKQQKERIRA